MNNNYELNKTNVLEGLKAMLDHYKRLEYFTGDYSLKYRDDNKVIITFQNKKVLVSVFYQLDKQLFNKDFSYYDTCIDINYFSMQYDYKYKTLKDVYEFMKDDSSAALIAILTGDNALVVFDKKLLQSAVSGINLYRYARAIHKDTLKDITGIYDGKEVVAYRSITESLLLSFNYYDLLSDTLFDTMTLINVNEKEVVY